MKRIYLIDCPGVVPPSLTDTDADVLLRGSVRVENVANPAQYVAAALGKCQKRHVERTYDTRGWTTAEELLEKLARKSGKLLKGGEVDFDTVAKSVLQDFLRGKIPWFVPPAGMDVTKVDFGKGKKVDGAAIAGGKEANGERVGTTGDMTRLNKIPVLDMRKRKRDDEGKNAEEDDEDEDAETDDDADSAVLGGSGTEPAEGDEEEDDSNASFSDSDDDEIDKAEEGHDEDDEGVATDGDSSAADVAKGSTV